MSDSKEELQGALYKLIADVSAETEEYIESKGRLIRLPMDARIEPIMSLWQSRDPDLSGEELRQRLKFEALVPLVSGIIIKRKREKKEIGDESPRYNLAIDTIIRIFDKDATLNTKTTEEDK